jgi:hypothetical protein
MSITRSVATLLLGAGRSKRPHEGPACSQVVRYGSQHVISTLTLLRAAWKGSACNHASHACDGAGVSEGAPMHPLLAHGQARHPSERRRGDWSVDAPELGLATTSTAPSTWLRMPLLTTLSAALASASSHLHRCWCQRSCEKRRTRARPRPHRRPRGRHGGSA